MLDSLQDGDHGLGNFPCRVVAELVQGVIRIGTDHGNRLEILLQRQEILLILEQHDSFSCGSESEILMRLRMYDLQCLLRVDIGMLEESETKFFPQDPAHGEIDQRYRHPAFVDILNKRSHVGRLVSNV